jgi:hypothetical protein
MNALDDFWARRTLEEKIIEYLISARGYCDPHPDLTKAQLLFEMERARRTLDYVITQVASTRGVSFSTPTGQAQT